jgi:hypothetical protein
MQLWRGVWEGSAEETEVAKEETGHKPWRSWRGMRQV